MFPSSGLFADINCPVALRGLCERPHCLFKHATKLWDKFELHKSAVVDLTGDHCDGPCAVYGPPVNDETTGACFHELERINKEIETVRHEVEQEQKRLSCYQTVQSESKRRASVSKCEFPTSADHKAVVRPRKYVVDNSKPRTDLEYDPLSNFSAALRSYSSSGKEQKAKNRQDVKKSRLEHFDQQAQISQLRSPAPLDDSSEDSILIIDDVSFSEQSSVPAQKPVDSVVATSSQDSPLVNVKNAEPLGVTYSCMLRDDKSKTYTHRRVECNEDVCTSGEGKECKNASLDGSIVDLTECSNDHGTECQVTSFHSSKIEENIPEHTSFSATTHLQDYCLDNFQHELSRSVDKTNPSQESNGSRFCKVEPDHSPLQQHAKKSLATVQNRVDGTWSSMQSVASIVQDVQKMSNKMPVQMLGKTAMNHSSSVRYQEQAEAAPGSSQFPVQNVSPVHLHLKNGAEPSEQLLRADSEAFIVINSSPDDEEEEEEEEDDEEDLSYLEVDLSDSDPMEECYRIFMEAHNEDKGNEECHDTSTGSTMKVEKSEENVTLQSLPGRKRVAHEAKHTEQPLAKIRPEPQVLVPLREQAVSGFGSRASVTSRIQQVQQRASALSASVKAGQSFISSNFQKKLESQTSPSALTQTAKIMQPASLPNAYLNYIPVGTAVIEVGNNLHLVLPHGSLPLSVASTSGTVNPVLTPVSQMHPSTVTVKQTYHPSPVAPLPRYRSTAPVLIAAPARRPALNSAFASTSLQSPASSTAPNAAAKAAAKPVPSKRKLKQQCEAPKEKVPHNVRQRYVNMFTEEILKTTPNVNDAFQKALAEEKAVYNRSANKLKYLSVAVNALKRLKHQRTAAVKNEKEVNSQKLKGNIPLNSKKIKGNDDMAFFESLKDYVLSDERMIESNYPVQHPEKRGCAVLFADKKGTTDPLKRICCRCGATYSVSQTGKHIRKEECNYHHGKGVESRVPGGVETRYSCCQGVMGAPGCQLFKLHVHDMLSLDGFVSTAPRRPSHRTCPGVYSLNCEMCYTVKGLELSRVTVVNSDLQIIYDTFVQPDHEVIDYNTRFSGISEKDVKGSHSSLREVQETLLSFISADTILVGHGLDMDLCLLKLIHGTVVDTAVVFPHRLGPPHKLSLNNLTAEYLRRIIQESVCGHDTAEDAAACLELMLWKVKEDGKIKK